jgi:tripartite-type tricarboxylate transporter receptor subunit TctC
VIENRPGAGGSLASALVAQSAPDGQTLLFANFATHAVTPTLFPDLTYDPIKDFKPVTLIASQPHLILVTPSLPVNSLAELIDYAKKNPGKLNFASAGVGSPLHLAAEYFKIKTGTDLVHVPYKSSAPALLDLIAGRVQVFFDNVSTALPYVQSGKVRALAITSSKRSPLAPDIPTVAEAGLADFETYGWWGIAAPAKTPPEVIEKLSAAYVAGLKTPEVSDKLASQGYTVIASSPAEFETYIKNEISKWAPVIKAAKLAPTN